MKLDFCFRVIGIGLLASASFAYGGTINGTVTNKTSGKVSAGDKVTLLSLSAALDEIGSTKTDARGQFKLTTPTEAPYLIKVEHQKSSYFKNVPPGTSQVEIVVYDVGTRVEGVSTEADVLRIEAENGQLKITENYFVKNISSPPRTESNDKGYEVVLPAEATLEGAATVGPSNMPLAATPDPVQPKGHYSFNFPIRPNEGESGTRFQLTYHLPYSGSYKFSPKLMQPSDNLAIMLPKSMRFEPGAGTSYQPVQDDATIQTFLMRNIHPGQPLEFTVAGTGSMPRDTQSGPQGAAGQSSQAGSQAGADDSGQAGGPGGKPGGGLGNPIDTPDPLHKYLGWIIGASILVLVAAAAFLLRKPAEPSTGAPVTGGAIQSASFEAQGAVLSTADARTKSDLLLDALKEELFSIESEKIAGKLSPSEYTELKAALETVLRRALGRQ